LQSDGFSRLLKRTCGALWANHTRVTHEEPELADHVFFSGVLADEGSMRDIQLRTGVRTDIINEAIDRGATPFLAPYASLFWLLVVYVSLVPYRAWTRVLLWLDRQVGNTWYHAGPTSGVPLKPSCRTHEESIRILPHRCNQLKALTPQFHLMSVAAAACHSAQAQGLLRA